MVLKSYELNKLELNNYKFYLFYGDNEGSKEETIKNSLSLKKLDGMNFNILDNSWKVTGDTSVNYISKFIKN